MLVNSIPGVGGGGGGGQSTVFTAVCWDSEDNFSLQAPVVAGVE